MLAAYNTIFASIRNPILQIAHSNLHTQLRAHPRNITAIESPIRKLPSANFPLEIKSHRLAIGELLEPREAPLSHGVTSIRKLPSELRRIYSSGRAIGREIRTAVARLAVRWAFNFGRGPESRIEAVVNRLWEAVKGTCPGVRSDTSHVTVALATKETAGSQYISFRAGRQVRSSFSPAV